MEFEINNTKWKIKEVDENDMKLEDEPDYCLGLTIYKKQQILLLKNQLNLLRTLKHELMHVWLYENGHNAQDKQFCHEDICEIVASSNDFINDIVEKYFKEK